MYTRKLLKKAVAIAKLKMFIVPAEKEKFAEEKKELDEGLKFCKALGVEELFDN